MAEIQHRDFAKVSVTVPQEINRIGQNKNAVCLPQLWKFLLLITVCKGIWGPLKYSGTFTDTALPSAFLSLLKTAGKISSS